MPYILLQDIWQAKRTAYFRNRTEDLVIIRDYRRVTRSTTVVSGPI